MNKIYYLVIAVAALVSFVSCNNDTDLDHKSIFPDGVDKTTQNEFDLWQSTRKTVLRCWVLPKVV